MPSERTAADVAEVAGSTAATCCLSARGLALDWPWHATMLGADLQADGIRVATMTIAGQIAAGTSFDPDRIAERYWEVVSLDGPWQAEFRFTGE